MPRGITKFLKDGVIINPEHIAAKGKVTAAEQEASDKAVRAVALAKVAERKKAKETAKKPSVTRGLSRAAGDTDKTFILSNQVRLSSQASNLLDRFNFFKVHHSLKATAEITEHTSIQDLKEVAHDLLGKVIDDGDDTKIVVLGSELGFKAFNFHNERVEFCHMTEAGGSTLTK